MADEIYSPDELLIEESLEQWVMIKCDNWRDNYESNYEQKFEEYYRLWRGQWDPADSERASERSRIISPALQQAVESNVAELEEATFGRGKWFDIADDTNDQDKQDILYLRKKLTEDFESCKIRKAVAECLINSAVFGTGIGEITLEEIKEMAPATQPIMDGQLTAVGVNITDRVVVKLKPVLPQNFLIDPVATSIEDAMGVAIDEFVSKHSVELLQEQGVYKEVYLESAAPDSELEPDQDLSVYHDDKVRLTKYYGLVPRELLEEEGVDVEEDSKYVEAVVVIANGGTLLKAEANPYMMQDRPVVAFPWDVVPSRFWGRGVCEKGYNSQKALDTELRARIDALALTTHPMMAVDATRIPRGHKLEVRPGRMLLTNGAPQESIMPFNFGQVNPTTFNQTGDLERQVQVGTGAMDSASPLAQNRRNETAGGMSMILGGSLKRTKRTLKNIERTFMKPLINKIAWRYMQFAPERYSATDMTFEVHSSLGMQAREMEQQQYANMMQTVPPESPAFWMLLRGIYENSSMTNREDMLVVIDQMTEISLQKQSEPEKPDPFVQVKLREIEVKAQLERAKLAQKQDKDNKDLNIRVEELRIEWEKLKQEREEMVLDAKLTLSGQEQDSAVTLVQMADKSADRASRKGGAS